MRRDEALGLLCPAAAGLMPVSQRVAGSLGAAPTAARRLDRGLIVAFEHVDAAGELGLVLGFYAIDDEQDRRAVGLLGPVSAPDWLRRRVAVAPGAARQRALVALG